MAGEPVNRVWVDFDGTEVGEAVWGQEFDLAGMTTDLMYDDPVGATAWSRWLPLWQKVPGLGSGAFGPRRLFPRPKS